MRALLLISVAASVVLAQGKPAAKVTRDGGVPPPARARAAPVADGGVPAPAAIPTAPSGEVERLRKEVNELRLRTLELERQQQAKVDEQKSQVEALGKTVEELEAQMKSLTDAEARRAEAEEAAVTRKTATAAASASLNSVLGVLASGNTGGVEASLRYAEGVFTGNAQKSVQLARAAIAQGDVSAARQYLVLALLEAEAQR